MLALGLAAIVPPLMEGPLSSQTARPGSEQPAPDALATAVRALSAAEPVARARAACEVGLRGADAVQAIPALVPLLADDTRVERATCDEPSWDRHGMAIGGEPLVYLTSPAREAARALARIGAAALEPLFTALADARATMRRYAAAALGLLEGQAGAREAVDRLVRAAGDAEWQVRRSVVWALGRLDDPRAFNPLLGRLRDEHPHVREVSARSLGELDDVRAVAALGQALADGDWAVRREAARALGEIEDPSAIDPLARALADQHARVRETAAWALGEIEDPRAVPALARSLADAEPTVREKAAWALGEIESPAAVEPLGVALRDSDARVRQMAAWALGQIAGE